MEILLGLVAVLAAASLGLNIWLILLLRQTTRQVSSGISTLQTQASNQFKKNEQNRKQQQGEILARIEQLKLELSQELSQQTEHLDTERIKVLGEMRHELSAAIDRLENFLREPLI